MRFMVWCLCGARPALTWVVFTLPLSMGRPMTFRGRKPTSSSSSSSSTGEFGNPLSVLCELEFCFICKRKLLRKGTAVGGGRLDDLAVLDLSMASDEGWSTIEGKD